MLERVTPGNRVSIVDGATEVSADERCIGVWGRGALEAHSFVSGSLFNRILNGIN